MTVDNDNNVKFVTADNSTNNYSNASYDFNTNGAVAVKVEFSYWIANDACNYDVAFIIRDKGIEANHAKQKMGLSGAFISIGRSRQSRVNYFSINQNKTIIASNNNLGLWCKAEIYIDLIKKTIDYTVSGLDNNQIIKQETGISFKDANATNVNQIDFFACVNNETDYIDNLVITKYTEKLPSYSYTVNAACEGETIQQLGSGVACQNTSYDITGIPFVVTKDGINYKLNDNEVKNFKKSFTMGGSNATETVSYSLANDISYFFEAENILSKSYGNNKGDYSGGTTAGVYQKANMTMPSIVAGVYTVTVNSSVRRSNEDILNVQVSTDNINWTDAGTITLISNKGGDYSADNIILPADGYIRLVEGKSQNMVHYVDYIVLKKTGEYIILNTALDYTNSTFCSDHDLDFSTVNDVEVYKAAIEGNKVVTTKIEDGKVKAGTGVIIKNVNHVASVTVPVTSGVADLEGNALVGVTKDMTNNDFQGKTAYILVSDTQFQRVDATVEGTIKKGKAYIEIQNAGAKPAMLFMGDTTTGIDSVESQANGDDAIYTIQGIRVKDTNAKGIYIINGKKYKF